MISNWINRSPHHDFELSKKERRFLRDVALRTWRYFAEFSNEKNHWLIPDNVQEEPWNVAERISPTNLGLLFNARQAALEFGYHHAARISDADGTHARNDLEAAPFSRASRQLV